MGQNCNIKKTCPIAEFSTFPALFSENSSLKAMGQNYVYLWVINKPKRQNKIMLFQKKNHRFR